MPTTSVSRVIHAPAHDIWAVLSNITDARRWNPAWQKIELVSNQTHGAGTRFRAHVDDETAFEFEISDWVVPEFISFRPIREEHERYSISLESQAFRLTPMDDDTTNVELIAHASTHGLRGLLMGVFFWGGHQKAGLSSALDNVHALFEPELFEDDEEEGELVEEEDEPRTDA